MGNVAIGKVFVDYPLSTHGHIRATDLSEVIDNQYSHDRISQMLYTQGSIRENFLCWAMQTRGG